MDSGFLEGDDDAFRIGDEKILKIRRRLEDSSEQQPGSDPDGRARPVFSANNSQEVNLITAPRGRGSHSLIPAHSGGQRDWGAVPSQ